MNALLISRTDDAEDQQLAELVEQITAALQSGAHVEIDEYIARYPSYADQLRNWMMVMTAMAELGHALAEAKQTAPADGSDARADATAAWKHTARADNDGLVAGVLGDFRILGELGRGGMGVVYEAEQISLGRRVALKVLPFAAMLDKQQLARFKNEARAAATLDHPNIVSIYSVGSERGVHYYAMQLVEGRSLAQVVEHLRSQREAGRTMLDAGKKKPASIQYPASSIEHQADTVPVAALSTLPAFDSHEYYRTVARLGIQAAEALDHAHQNGVLHRDVKPGNLMIDDAGKLWITDFGLARIEADAGMTMTGDLVGTLRYMSPEQALGKRVVVDHRCDIYSLGVTLYELLTLQPAFPGDDRHELLRQIAFEEPRKLKQIHSSIPMDLETIILKAIEKNATDRYPSAKELADDLRSFLAHKPIKAKPPMWLDRVVKWSRRHPTGVRATLLSAIATTVVLATSVGWIARDQAARRNMLTEQVRQALDEANTLYAAGDLGEALSSCKRADQLLQGGNADAALKRAVTQRQRDLATVQRLDQVRAERVMAYGDRKKLADQAYDRACQQYDLDVRSADQSQVIKQIKNSPIREELIAALDDWSQAAVANGTREKSQELIDIELLQLATLCDSDAWRIQVRAAIQRRDQDELLRLASDETITQQNSAAVLLLVRGLTNLGQLPQAVDLLKSFQASHPSDFWINHELASSLGKTRDAVDFHRVAVALRPNSALAFNYLGTSLINIHRWNEAEAAFRDAIRLYPGDWTSYLNLVQLLCHQNRVEEAKSLYRDLPEPPPYLGHGEYMCLGKACELMGELADAEAAYRKALPSALNDFYLGGVLLAQGKHAEAEAFFREAVSKSPNDEVFSCNLALCLASQHKQVEADEFCRKSIELKTTYPFPYWYHAAFLQDQGKHEEAAGAWAQLVEVSPDHIEEKNELAWLLATCPRDECRNAKRALEVATQLCLDSEYKNPAFLDTLAAAYAESGDFEAALTWSNKAIGLADNDALRDELTKHLNEFNAQRPWRQDPAYPSPPTGR